MSNKNKNTTVQKLFRSKQGLRCIQSKSILFFFERTGGAKPLQEKIIYSNRKRGLQSESKQAKKARVQRRREKNRESHQRCSSKL